MRLSSLGYLFLPLLLCVGCASFEKPEPSPTIGTEANCYSIEDFNSDYAAYNAAMGVLVSTPSSATTNSTYPAPLVTNGSAATITIVRPADYALARILRDRMINKIMTDIDTNYGEYKGHLHTGRAGIQTAGDAASLGLSAAATVAGGSALKAILAAADTGLKGVTKSYDTNFFAQQTTEILVTRMDALHQAKKTDIRTKMAGLDVTKYGFEEAKDDLTELFYVGTREAALVALAADAGQKKVEAQAASDAATTNRVDMAQFATPTTADQFNMVKATRAKLEALYAGPETALVQTATKILTDFNGAAPLGVVDKASAQTALEAAFVSTKGNKAQLTKFYKLITQ